MATVLRGTALSLLALAASSAFTAPPAAAQSGQLVTIAARVCPAYTDITANRARNNIQESLKDLGADTPYKNGEVVEAATEDRVQPNCRALENWRLTLGRGIESRAVTGPWGSLSIVTNPFADDIVTRESTPLLNDQGVDTGDDLTGAVTFELSNEQAELAKKPSKLWLQGGTTTDPALYGPSGGGYGFGALRCSSDNLNGDNVEWITFASGRRHVFCYAYYVSPPPTGGTIVVRKETVGAPAGAMETFAFQGNISFNPDGGFKLRAGPGAPAQMSFARAETGPGEAPWTFAEQQLPAGWALESLSCDSPTAVVNQQARSVAVSLVAGDTVTCTYVDRLVPPPGGLLLRKISRGELGTFPFEIEPVGGGAARNASATTTTEGVAVDADPSQLDLDPGNYRITERLPDSNGGKWQLSKVDCDGEELPPTEQQTVSIESGQGTICTYNNLFIPDGSIKVRLVTLGGTATAAYEVGPRGPADPSISTVIARTNRPGVPALAEGDDLSSIPVRGYEIRQDAIGAGKWQLVAVTCDGEPVPFDQGGVGVLLTEAKPNARCTFVNRRHNEPEPPTPGPTPGPVPTDPPVPGPLVPKPEKAKGANLVVTKVANRNRYTLGDKVRYRVRVKNKGPGKAVDVTIHEQEFSSEREAKLLSLKPSKGRCIRVPQGKGTAPACLLGDLRPGESATIRAVVRPTKTGVYRNTVAAGTDSVDPNRRAPIAREKVIVGEPPPEPGPFAPCRC